jgi:hypothetical protein
MISTASYTNYLKEKWSDHSAEKFATRTMKRLERIATMPYVPAFTSQPAIQMIKLDRKNVLFFTIENDFMILLSIYPYKKDITRSKYY